MRDDEIIEQLRAAAPGLSAVKVAAVLDRLLGGLTHGSLITFFKRAFPQIPLPVLLDACSWRGIERGSVSDDEFDAMLRPWLPGAEEQL